MTHDPMKGHEMKNVLLVDDDSVFQMLGKKVLDRLGFYPEEVHTALNGKQALDLFNDYYSGTKSLPDVILLDLNMPVMDGFAFLEAFRRLTLPNKDKVKIVIVTSSFNPNDMQRAKALGAHEYLQKPLREEQLKSILCAA